MNPKRQNKLRERAARHRKMQARQLVTQTQAWTDLNIQREIDYIVERAREHDTRCVSIRALFFFSTQSGDAWMLDLEDGLAVCLARAGEKQPVRLIEMDRTTAVEWDRTFSIADDRFTTTVKQTGQSSTMVGYPVQAIRAAIEQAMQALGTSMHRPDNDSN